MNSDTQAKILLVDDEEAILSTLTLFLGLSGFQVVTAGNGAEALDRVTAYRGRMARQPQHCHHPMVSVFTPAASLSRTNS